MLFIIILDKKQDRAPIQSYKEVCKETREILKDFQ